MDRVGELEYDRGGLFEDGFGSGGFGPGRLRWVARLAGFEAVLGGYYVVVVALVEELEGLTAVGGRLEASGGLFGAEVSDVVGEVGAEEGVLAGAGGGYAGAGDVARPGEGGVQARGGEGGVLVAGLQVMALDGVA